MSTSPLPTCAFCKIAAAHPPIPPSTFLQPSTPATVPAAAAHPTIVDSSSSTTPVNPHPVAANAPADPESHAFLVLSTKHVLAFLDIMPLTRGHLLLVPREHYEKVGEVGVRVSRELGQWLPILSRVVMRTIFGGVTEENPNSSTSSSAVSDPSWNWNVVQNNGIGAAQVVPHVHFHIVPRPPLGPASPAAKMSYIMFGRGRREDLDDDEGEELAGLLRGELARELRRVREVEGVDLEGEGDFDAGLDAGLGGGNGEVGVGVGVEKGRL